MHPSTIAVIAVWCASTTVLAGTAIAVALPRRQKAAVELLSPMPLEACRRVLDDEIDNGWKVFGRRRLVPGFGRHPLVGRMKRTWLRVARRSSSLVRNQYKTYLTATLSTEGEHTLIRCRFGIHPIHVAITIIWLAGVAWFSGGGIAVSLLMLENDPQVSGSVWLSLTIPLGMLLVGVGLVRLGRYAARNQGDELLGILCDTVKAVRRA